MVGQCLAEAEAVAVPVTLDDAAPVGVPDTDSDGEVDDDGDVAEVAVDVAFGAAGMSLGPHLVK